MKFLSVRGKRVAEARRDKDTEAFRRKKPKSEALSSDVTFFSTPSPAAPAGGVATEKRRLKTDEHELQQSADPNNPSKNFFSEGLFLDGGTGLAWMQKQGTWDAQTVNIFAGATSNGSGELGAITPNKPLFTTSLGDDDMNTFGHKNKTSTPDTTTGASGNPDMKNRFGIGFGGVFSRLLGPTSSGHQGKNEGTKNEGKEEGKNDTLTRPGVGFIGTTVAERRAAAASPLVLSKFRVVARNAVSGEEFEIE
ncbi:unnamed protein product, partial [Amoebophrya sp. A25]|eukprot:GSA25T00004667001.1